MLRILRETISDSITFHNTYVLECYLTNITYGKGLMAIPFFEKYPQNFGKFIKKLFFFSQASLKEQMFFYVIR